MEIPIESKESSSPMITRAVAAGLRNQYIDNYDFPAWQKMILLGLGLFPQSTARNVISRFQSISGLSQKSLANFSLSKLINDRINDYSELTDQYPVVVLGAGLGGATTFLSLSLGGPFLPQSFVISLKKGSYTNNSDEYLHRSLTSAREIAQNDSRLMTIQHFDPIHDGWLTKFVNHLRFKLIDLPDEYINFIKKMVKPGGTIVYLEGGATWLRYRVGERSVFQIGGWGDITAQEFLNGSERLQRFSVENRQKFYGWALKENFPLETGPESEWGSEPGLSNALEKFCISEGYRFAKLHLSHPNDFSRLAFFAAKQMIEKDNREPAGTLIECFSQFDSTAALKSGLLPLWLIFNTVDNAAYLEEMAVNFPSQKPIFFSPLVTFSHTPDIANWDNWLKVINKQFINIGTRKSHYPSDASALVRWVDPLRKWVSEHEQPVKSRLSPEELQNLSRNFL